ncbi:hypothetical protein [Flavihumibacter fluvii]|uniref:hypothetical protein n=1 Tax=Flavihumibacter fluvii TaxID=2838157 RepID=UPI001BDE31FC|nr:hypothetical protein [Flavihumibacter fluvii]ULQ54574.1 hypothetical protein KJS93_09600 [Flavihumibacter fluvii]
MKKATLSLGFCIALTGQAISQSGLNSIYSAFGIGDVQMRDYSGYGGMGALGVAMPSEKTLNDINPASYGFFPSNRLTMELSLGGKTINYISSSQYTSGGDFTIQKAAMGVSLFKNWGTSFGIKRYSNIDYLTLGDRYLLGTESKLSSKIEGHGGLYNFFFSNGFKIGRHLNLGLTIGYISGSVNRTEEILSSATDAVTLEKNTLYQNFIMNTGIQYQFKTGKVKWIAGATFQPRRTLNTTVDNLVSDASGNTLVAQKARSGHFEYPAQWGAGLTMIRKEWKFGVDHIGQNWSAVNYSGIGFQTTNASNWAAGFSYHKPRQTIFGVVDGITYSAGITWDQSYLVIDGVQINSLAGTAGISVPSRNGLYQYHFSVKAGQKGKSTYPLVKEKFVEFNINLSLSSILYTGGRKYD